MVGPRRLGPRLRGPPVAAVLQRNIEDPLALALLEGQYLDGATVTVAVDDDRIVLR